MPFVSPQGWAGQAGQELIQEPGTGRAALWGGWVQGNTCPLREVYRDKTHMVRKEIPWCSAQGLERPEVTCQQAAKAGLLSKGRNLGATWDPPARAHPTVRNQGRPRDNIQVQQGTQVIRQQCGNKAGLRSTWEVILQIRVRIESNDYQAGLQGQSKRQAIPHVLRQNPTLPYRSGLIQHSLNYCKIPWAELKQLSWYHGCGWMFQVRLVRAAKTYQCPQDPDTHIWK